MRRSSEGKTMTKEMNNRRKNEGEKPSYIKKPMKREINGRNFTPLEIVPYCQGVKTCPVILKRR
jgi:hypothetical protein